MTEITDITTPGKEGAFTVGSRGTVKGPGDLPPDHLRLIEGAVTATVGTYDSKGIARLTPMWWGTDGDHIHINTKKGRLKYKKPDQPPRGLHTGHRPGEPVPLDDGLRQGR